MQQRIAALDLNNKELYATRLMSATKQSPWTIEWFSCMYDTKYAA